MAVFFLNSTTIVTSSRVHSDVHAVNLKPVIPIPHIKLFLLIDSKTAVRLKLILQSAIAGLRDGLRQMGDKPSHEPGVASMSPTLFLGTQFLTGHPYLAGIRVNLSFVAIAFMSYFMSSWICLMYVFISLTRTVSVRLCADSLAGTMLALSACHGIQYADGTLYIKECRPGGLSRGVT